MTNENTSLTASGEAIPAEFLARMRDMLGEDFDAFCASFSHALAPSLRVNPLKGDADAVREALPYLGDTVPWQAAGFYYPATATDGAEDAPRPGKHPLHEAGLYYIQEASAMLPASLCPPRPGERVLDLCAAPGGKATQLAGALMGEGLLVANEIHPTRAAILSQNLERMGVRNAVVTNAAPQELSYRFNGFFDKIVVDAPCSGEGMFRREADAVRMWSPDNVSLCARRQAEILDEAALMLAPDGLMVYSTCTFAPAEDEGAVMDFLLRHPDFEILPSVEPLVVSARASGLLDGGHAAWVEDCGRYPAEIRAAMAHAYRVLPHHAPGEGHFAVILHRKGGERAPVRETARKNRKNQVTKGNPSSDAAAFGLFCDFLCDFCGKVPAWVGDMTPCLLGERLYLVPKSLGTTPDEVRQSLRGVRVLRAGLCVGTVIGSARGGRFEPDHALAAAWQVSDGGCIFPVESISGGDADACAASYLHGETLPAPEARGWHVVTYRGLALGFGKASDGIMKNHYPKGLRK